MDIAEFSISDLVDALRRNKLKVAACFLLIMGCTLALNRVLPRKYESEARLMVRLGRENATLDPTTTLGEAATVSITQTREAETKTVATMLSSRAIAERVVDAVGPETILNEEKSDRAEEPKQSTGAGARVSAAVQWAGAFIFPPNEEIEPRDRAIRKLQNGLRVHAIDNTSLISVTYQSRNPDLSQTVVSSVVDNYGAEHVRVHRATGANRFLEDQKRILRDELQRAESELVELKNRSELFAPAEQQAVLVERLGALHSELFALEAALVESQTELDDLKQTLASVAQEEAAVPLSSANSEASDAMRGQLYQLQLEAQNTLASYSTDHVKAKHLRRQIEAGKQILAREEASYGIQKLKPLVKTQRLKAEKLREQIAQLEGDLRRLNEDEMLISRLERTIELRDAAFRQVSADAEQSRIDHSLELAKITNISLVQPATRDPYAVFPNVRLNLLVALMLAMFVSPGLAIWSESRRTYRTASPRTPDSSDTSSAAPSEPAGAVSPEATQTVESPALSKPR